MKSLGSGQPPCFSTATVKEEKQQFQEKKKKKVMIDGIQLEDTLYTLHQESQNQNNGNKL